MDVQAEMARAIQKQDLSLLKEQFSDSNEFIAIENFLPSELIEHLLDPLPVYRTEVHRNYIPLQKKGGAVNKFYIDRISSAIRQVYYSPDMFAMIRELSEENLIDCPVDDPHTYALYFYTEPGDHIGFHYDTSYYWGKRYTILLGLIDNSSCELVYDLYLDDKTRETKRCSVPVKPGTLVFFNGGRLHHKVTPLGENEERVVLTMEYLTDHRMSRFGRFISNMKDSLAYFGLKHVFWEAKKKARI